MVNKIAGLVMRYHYQFCSSFLDIAKRYAMLQQEAEKNYQYILRNERRDEEGFFEVPKRKEDAPFHPGYRRARAADWDHPLCCRLL